MCVYYVDIMVHIPASDALDKQRVGRAQKGSATAVVVTYELPSDESGCPQLSDAFTRPFPVMFRSSPDATVIEPFIQSASIDPLSDDVINYANEVYTSIENREWTETIHETDLESFDEETQLLLAGLVHVATNTPAELYNAVLRNAHSYVTRENQSGGLSTNPLHHDGDFERNNSPYLPNPESLDNWTLRWYVTEQEDDAGKTFRSESLWLVYSIEGESRERPLVAAHTENTAMSLFSEDVSYSEADNHTVPYDLIVALLSDEYTIDDSILTSVDVTDLEETQTLTYLTEYLVQ